HFMGICTYTLVRLCDGTSGLPSFHITAKNEHRGNPSVSYVQRVLVEVYGQQIEIVKGHAVRLLNGSVTAGRDGRFVTLQTDFRLAVSYDTDATVQIKVPTDYFNKTCGMCGNFNSLQWDDHMMPSGELAKNSTQLGNSWQVPDAEYDRPSCAPLPDGEPCPPPQQQLYQSEAFCGLLTSTRGPFASCLSVLNPTSFFESCVFDLCALQGSQQALCNALQAYGDACQDAGVQLLGWRNATFSLPCGANSHYNPCASACPATCPSLPAPANCSKPCVEDCECDPGFVLSGQRCVLPADCGCLAGDRYYEVGAQAQSTPLQALAATSHEPDGHSLSPPTERRNLLATGLRGPVSLRRQRQLGVFDRHLPGGPDLRGAERDPRLLRP
uniref:VWFD domain-containing protein n=1 Tax=Varanus komodoensis TaxID=61221 RepID=A0A8D2JLA8_VARKO